MNNREFLIHLFDELNLINWVVVAICAIAISFASAQDTKEFLKNVALTSLPTGVVLRNKEGKNKNDG